jgi:hypothetical protein
MLASTKRSNVLALPTSPKVSKELMVRLLGDAWITFITKSLTTSDGLGHKDITWELEKLEEAGQTAALRIRWHNEINNVLEELLSCTPKERVIKCQQTDIKLMAMALDKVQSTTFKFIEMGRPDREVPVHVLKPLLDMFYESLLE